MPAETNLKAEPTYEDIQLNSYPDRCSTSGEYAAVVYDDAIVRILNDYVLEAKPPDFDVCQSPLPFNFDVCQKPLTNGDKTEASSTYHLAKSPEVATFPVTQSKCNQEFNKSSEEVTNKDLLVFTVGAQYADMNKGSSYRMSPIISSIPFLRSDNVTNVGNIIREKIFRDPKMKSAAIHFEHPYKNLTNERIKENDKITAKEIDNYVERELA